MLFLPSRYNDEIINTKMHFYANEFFLNHFELFLILQNVTVYLNILFLKMIHSHTAGQIKFPCFAQFYEMLFCHETKSDIK